VPVGGVGVGEGVGVGVGGRWQQVVTLAKVEE